MGTQSFNVSRLSRLRRDVFPGHVDDADFQWPGRLRVCPPKLRGDDHATELDDPSRPSSLTRGMVELVA